jgi:hypothetical protein
MRRCGAKAASLGSGLPLLLRIREASTHVVNGMTEFQLKLFRAGTTQVDAEKICETRNLIFRIGGAARNLNCRR